MENQGNLILIDALTFSTKIWSVEDLKRLLGLFDYEWQLAEYGRYGYKRREFFNGVHILSDGRLDEAGNDTMGVCVEISGQGCRTLETYGKVDWLPFLSYLIIPDNEIKFTRIDIAFDDHSGILDKLTLKVDTDSGFYRSRFRYWEVRYGSKGFSLYHGSNQSNVRIRIYDKAAERGLLDGTHWIRVEFQIRDENAIGIIQEYVSCGDIGKVFGGVLSNYVVYCEPSEDSNKSRWLPTDYWAQLIGEAQRIQIAAKPGVDYNVFRLEAFIRDTAGGALLTWIKIFGVEKLPDLLKTRKGKLNPKYKQILEDYRQQMEM